MAVRSNRCWFDMLQRFFFNDAATTEIYTLSLHDALPISRPSRKGRLPCPWFTWIFWHRRSPPDRKSTRLNSSHVSISYAVFCLKNKMQVVPGGPPLLHQEACRTVPIRPQKT